MAKRPQYLRVESLEEALSVRAERGEDARPLAGGTDLLVEVHREGVRFGYLLDIGGLEALRYIREEEGWLAIGALTTFAALEESELVRQQAPELALAAGSVGGPAIRNMGTLGGNLVQASPAADLAPPLLALEAEVVLAGEQGQRSLPLSRFFLGPGQTMLGEQELLTEVRLPLPAGRRSGTFIKIGRRKALALSVASVAASLSFKGGRCDGARLALGAVAPTPMRARGAEALLVGAPLSAGLLAEAAAMAAGETSPIDDIHASAWYRRDVTRVIVRRALEQCLRQA